MPADLTVSVTGARAAETATTARAVETGAAPRTAGTAAGTRPATGDGSTAPAQREEASHEQLRSAIDDAVARLTEKGSELTFQLDHDSGRVIVKLVDRNTREVLRQVPSKEALAVARALRDGGTLGTLVSTDA